jgi:hypothetical protein
MEAHFIVGTAHARLGQMQAGCERHRCSLALHDGPGHANLAAVFGSDPRVHASAELAYSLHHMGRFTEAHALADETVATGRERRHPLTLSLALIVVGIIHLRAGRHAVGRATVAELEGVLEQHPSAHVMWLPFLTAWADIESGRAGNEAVARMASSVDALRSAGSLYSLASLQAQIAALHLHFGSLEKALSIVDGALADETDERDMHAELLRIRGAVLANQALAADRSAGPRLLDAAECAFRDAVALSRTQGLGLWELRAGTALASLLIHTGRLRAARVLTAGLAERFANERDDVRDLVELRALMAEVEAADG